jgi:hypothetical protein
VEFGIPVAGRLRELDRDATHPHCRTTLSIVHEQWLFIDGAAAAGALTYGATEAFALHLAMLPDDEHRATLRHAEQQRPGTKVAILDPKVICLDVLEHLRNQAAFLGMAILVEKDIGNQHTLLGQHDQGLPR